jgi:predicted Zn-dependent peptidase
LLDETDLCREVLTLMSEMLFHPLIDENGLLHERYVEQEKKNAIDHLRSRKNHPSSYAMARFLDAFRDDDPFSLPLIQGAEDRVRAITPERLTQLWQELLRCAPIHLFYVGGIPSEQLVECLRSVLESAFAGIGRVSRPVTACPRLALPPRRELRRLQEQGEEGQSHLILGFRSGVTLSSPDYYAMMLCHELLGQSPISRLFVHVREAHSLCYSCFSMYSHERGEVIVSCGISAENRDRAEQAILEQIEVLKRGDFSQAEWIAAKKSLIGSCRQLEDSTNGLASFYEKRIRLCPNHTIEEYVTRYQALTREDVMAVAQKLCPDMIYFRQGMGRDEREEEGTDE